MEGVCKPSANDRADSLGKCLTLAEHRSARFTHSFLATHLGQAHQIFLEAFPRSYFGHMSGCDIHEHDSKYKHSKGRGILFV